MKLRNFSLVREITFEAWIGMTAFNGWRYPLVEVTGILLHDVPSILSYNPWHRKAWHDFDRDVWVLAWWPLLPFALAYAWWFRSRSRRCIEFWLHRRVMDVPEGEVVDFHCEYIRPLNRWTWRRTRRV